MPALSTLRQSAFAARLVEGWRWWCAELAAMVPERLRARRRIVPVATIRASRSAVVFEREAGGVGQRFVEARPLEALDAEGWADLAILMAGSRATLVLETPDSFTTMLVLPKAARSRLRAAVSLQLPQIAPLDPLMLEWGTRVIAFGEREITVQIAMARASRIDAIQSLFTANGIAPPPIHAATPDGTIELARGHDHSVSLEMRIERRMWLAAAAIVATIPLTLLAGAALLTSTSRGRAEGLQKELAPKIAAESRTRRAEDLRRALRLVVQRPSASDVLETLAGRLPVSAYLLSADQGPDRRLTLSVNSADPDATGARLAGARQLPGLAMTDQSAAADGRMIVQYRTAAR